MNDLIQGQIIEAYLPDQAGRNHKDRPAVILTSTNKVYEVERIRVVAVTSRFDEPVPDVKVKLPWMYPRGGGHRGHPVTGLNRPSVAICNWVCSCTTDEVKRVGGFVPAKYFDEIWKQVQLAVADMDGDE